MKICFFGVGGVGGYFGSLVAQRFSGIHPIYFIARGAHKDEICSNGLTLKKSGGEEMIRVFPDSCTDTVSGLPVCDIIILSVKGYDLDNASREISKITDRNTVILPLLNGVDIYESIRKNLKTGIVLPSCVYVATHIESPGVIFQNGGNCKICTGKDPAHPQYYPEPLLDLLTVSGIDHSWEENVYTSIWSKYIFIAAYGLVTAATRKTLGEVYRDPELSRITKSIMTEIKQLAGKMNVPLGKNIVENSYEKAGQFPFEAKTSFQRDVEAKGNINEGDIFGGTIIRLGKAFNIPVPASEKMYTKILNLNV